MSNRVVVTGAGTISCLGADWQQVSERLKKQEGGVRFMSEWQCYHDLRTRLAAPIDDFSMPPSYTRKKLRAMGRVAQLGVRASELALKDAGLFEDPILRSGQTGVAYGSATGSSAAAMEFFGLLENNSMERVNGSTYLRMMSHSAAVNISIAFGTTGRLYTTSSACTAGSQGIGQGFEAIRHGLQTVMLCGGAEELCPTQAAVFDVVGATSTRNDQANTSPQPFDKDRDGLVIGEGACTLILENLEHAKARGAKILAEVIGYETNTDGAHVVKPQKQQMENVMRLALDNAGLAPSDIGYISAHGTATRHGDIAESQASYTLFGGNVPISSLKSYTGHTLGACGAFEAWAAIMMMREKWFAPTINLNEPDSDCADLDYIQHATRPIDTDIVMSNNFAFGGINTSLIFKRQ